MSTTTDISVDRNSEKQGAGRIDPGVFAVLMFVISISMIFASMASAYIVRRAEGNWLEFELPSVLNWSTAAIVASSLSLVYGIYALKKEQKLATVGSLGLALLTGVMFLVLQFEAWKSLVDAKIFFGGTTANPSGSFVYVLTGIHGFHIITGLVYLLIIWVRSMRVEAIKNLRMAFIRCSIYWHFLGGMWIVLYLFLKLYR